MDFGLDTVPSVIASGTTNYVAEFSPIFTFIGGILLAVYVIFLLIEYFRNAYDDRLFERALNYSSDDLVNLSDEKLDRILDELEYKAGRIKRIERIKELQSTANLID